MRPSRVFFALAASLASSTAGSFASPAYAQSDDDRATARALGQDGEQALDSKDFRTAEDRFRRADKLVHAPTLMLGLARALAAEGKYLEAQETYNRIVREGLPPGAPEPFKRALEAAKKEVDTVAPKVAGVTITVKNATGADITDPKVVLDEKPVNSASLGVKRAVDPGPHTLRVNADGYKAFEVTFTVAEGASLDEPVVLESQAAAPAAIAPALSTNGAGGLGTSSTSTTASSEGHKRSVLPWVAFGVGGAGLVLGGITGLLAVGDHSTLKNNCPGGACPPAQSGNLSSYHTMGMLSTVGFTLAGVGVAGGVVLLATQPKDTGSSAPATGGLHIAPFVGLGSIGAVGRF
jgi:hypothetical protein